MKQHPTLTIVMLITIVLTSLHFTHDILHDSDGLAPGEVAIMLAILLILLIGTVMLAGRQAGFVIMLLGGLAAAYMPFLHGMGPRATRWGFAFIWTMLAMGVTGLFGAILSAQALWRALAPKRAS